VRHASSSPFGIATADHAWWRVVGCDEVSRRPELQSNGADEAVNNDQPATFSCVISLLSLSSSMTPIPVLELRASEDVSDELMAVAPSSQRLDNCRRQFGAIGS
jgi:hypothetical protein